MIRKYLSLMCVALMVLSLAACGNDKKKGESIPTPEVSASEPVVTESSEPEVPDEPEMVTTPVSDKNIYDSLDMEFVVDGVKINLSEALKDTTHNVLFLEDVIEIPVMQLTTDGVNSMLYNIVLSKEAMNERVATTTVGDYNVYVDAFDDSFAVTEIIFAEGAVEAPTTSDAASTLPELSESSAIETPEGDTSAAPATDVPETEAAATITPATEIPASSTPTTDDTTSIASSK